MGRGEEGLGGAECQGGRKGNRGVEGKDVGMKILWGIVARGGPWLAFFLSHEAAAFNRGESTNAIPMWPTLATILTRTLPHHLCLRDPWRCRVTFTLLARIDWAGSAHRQDRRRTIKGGEICTKNHTQRLVLLWMFAFLSLLWLVSSETRVVLSRQHYPVRRWLLLWLCFFPFCTRSTL